MQPTGSYWTSNEMQKKLKQEQKHCVEELQCNIVLMKGSQAKILKLNLGWSDGLQNPFFSASPSPDLDVRELHGNRMRHSTPVSSPEESNSSYMQMGQESLSSPDNMNSLLIVYEQNPLFEEAIKGKRTWSTKRRNSCDPLKAIELFEERVISPSATQTSIITGREKSVLWIPQNHTVHEKAPASRNRTNSSKTKSSSGRYALDSFVQSTHGKGERPGLNQAHGGDYFLKSSIREVVSLSRTSSIPPPLCSLCQHKSPAFGKPPRRFSFEELREATDRFSSMNLLADGEFGTVHRGVLGDGLVVAVKQLKFAGSQGDADFFREVWVLSCAQHRNVVLLIGFCAEGEKRVLVYEYICNGSLDFHLHVEGNKSNPLDWHSRQKIAIGAARGLRYLHEDCRVGCIVHRDMRPKNILLTHDYEPLVADFGVARLHTEWDPYDERVVGTPGYLAPEHFGGGKITEKVDIYAFGVILLELITGERSITSQWQKGQRFASDSFCTTSIPESDPLLANVDELEWCIPSDQLKHLPYEQQAMGLAAFLCLQIDPESRPPMSKVLRVLEGGDRSVALDSDPSSVGSRSERMGVLSSKPQTASRKRHSHKLSQ